MLRKEYGKRLTKGQKIFQNQKQIVTVFEGTTSSYHRTSDVICLFVYSLYRSLCGFDNGNGTINLLLGLNVFKGLVWRFWKSMHLVIPSCRWLLLRGLRDAHDEMTYLMLEGGRGGAVPVVFRQVEIVVDTWEEYWVDTDIVKIICLNKIYEI
jgi:hypothetical protein